MLAAAACAARSGAAGGGELPANSSLASHVEVSDSFVRSYQSEAQRQFYAATLTAPPTPQPSADCADSTAGGGGRALYVAVRGSAELPDAGLRFRLQVDVRARARARLADAAVRGGAPAPRVRGVPHKIPSDKVLASVPTSPQPRGLPEAAGLGGGAAEDLLASFVPRRRPRRRAAAAALALDGGDAAPTAPTAAFGAFSDAVDGDDPRAATATLVVAGGNAVCVADAAGLCRMPRRTR